MSDKTISEGDLIARLERLLDSLPDDAARQRVLEWATQRWGRKSEPAKTDSTKTGSGPAVNPPTWHSLSMSGDISGTYPEPEVADLVPNSIPLLAAETIRLLEGSVGIIGGPQRPGGDVVYRS